MSEDQLPAAKRRLTEQEKARLAEWYERYGEDVVQEVRRWLRKATKVRSAVSTLAIAQSVFASLMENHLEEVDVSDANGVWAMLAKAAKRHCEAWNRDGTRHRQPSLDCLRAAEPARDGLSAGFDPVDTREVKPEVVVMVHECSLLFRLLSKEEKEAVGQAMMRVEGAIGLIPRLTDREREVFGLKLVGKTRAQIAELLGVEKHEVDDSWKSVQRKAEAVTAETVD